MILIIGDHGSHSNIPTKWTHLKDVTGTALPMLWVKPFNSIGEFEATELPTSHIKLHSLLKELSGRDLTISQVDEVLKSDIRHFRKGRDTDSHYEDFYFDRSGKFIDPSEN